MELEELEKRLKEMLRPESDGWGVYSSAFRGYINQVASTVKPFTQVQTAAKELARTMGLSSKSIINISTNLIAANRKINFSLKYNISDEEVLGLTSSIMDKIGRNVAIDQVGTMTRNARGQVVNAEYEDSELENILAANRLLGPDMISDMIAGFDKVGISMLSAAKKTGKLYAEAGKYGINLRKYAQNFVSNLQMAQTFSFRRGVDGLKEMARKATEIRQDMKQIASFAEKVGSVTGAVETAANLQVLGGSFAALSNPLAMLNESLTDVEALQQRYSDMTAGMAYYDEEKGQIDVTPHSRMLLKRFAEATGTDYANLMDQVMAQGRREEIERQINRYGIGGVDEDLKNLLANVGQFDSASGLAGATIDGSFYTMSEISASKALQEKLIEETQSQEEDVKDIAMHVKSLDEHFTGIQSQMANEQAYNKIVPGVVNGVSTYNAAFNFGKNFDAMAVTGLGNMDHPSDNFKSVLQTSLNTALVDVVKPFNFFTNPDKFGQELSMALEKNLGNGPLATEINSAVTSFLEGAVTFLNGANDWSKAVTNGSFDALSREHSEAAKTTIKDAVGGAEPIHVAYSNVKSDVEKELNSTEETGGKPIISATDRKGEAAAAASVLTVPQDNGMTLEKFLENWSKNASKIGQITIKPAPGGGYEIASNQESIPTATVAQPAQEQQKKQTREEEKEDRDFNLNVTGTIRMNITGDNGDLGSIDIMNLFEREPSFKLQLAKLLADSIESARNQRNL